MISKGLIYSNQLTLDNKGVVIGYTNGKIAVKEIGRNIANGMIIKNHYSHKIYNATYIHLGIFTPPIRWQPNRGFAIRICNESCILQ